MQDDFGSDALRSTAGAQGAPGWEAINAALAALHPGQAARHFGASHPWTLGGEDPLDGISVYYMDAPRPHWHYVTYGFSELFSKETDDRETSGFGFELTFRLALPAGTGDGDPPPTWPLNLLQNLARYVFSSGNAFEQGHHMTANGPIALDHDTLLRHLAFMHDPQLPARMTPNGRVQFLQVIGLTDAEMAAVLGWSTEGLLQALEPAMPLWITDLSRPSLLDDPSLAATVEVGSLAAGSSTAALFVETLDWFDAGPDEPAELVIGAGQVATLLAVLPARLRHGRALEMVAQDRVCTFETALQDHAEFGDAQARVRLSPASLDALLAHVRAERGRYLMPGARLSIRVEPSVLRDGSGEAIRSDG